MATPDDYFALFGLDRRFDLDEHALNARYRELVTQTQAGGGTGEKEVEVARRVLADPELRADYLLDLDGDQCSAGIEGGRGGGVVGRVRPLCGRHSRPYQGAAPRVIGLNHKEH